MDKLISAEKLLKDPVFCGYHDGKQQHFNFGSATECIKNAPAVEAISLDELSTVMAKYFGKPCRLFSSYETAKDLMACWNDCKYDILKPQPSIDCWKAFFKYCINESGK